MAQVRPHVLARFHGKGAGQLTYSTVEITPADDDETPRALLTDID